MDGGGWYGLDDDQDGGWVSVPSGTGSPPGSPGQRTVKRLLLLFDVHETGCKSPVIFVFFL